VSGSSATLAAGQTDTITFAFSTAVTGFVLADVSVTGGTLSNLQQVAGNPTRYTALFTPAAGVSTQTAQIQVLAGGWTDAVGNAGTASNILSITENATLIGSGTTTEIGVASAATIDFVNGSGTTGNLVLDDSKDFSGQIIGFTGDGTVANSDSIDLKDIKFATATETYTENSAGTGGTLTVADGSNTAKINFTGNYVLANFKFSADASGGTLIRDPPITASQTTSLATSLNTGEDSSTTLGSPSEDTLPESANATKVVNTPLQGLESAGTPPASTTTSTDGSSLPQQTVDLTDIAFGANTTLGYGPNDPGIGGAGVNDGMHTASIALFSQYAAAGFQFANNNNGALVTNPLSLSSENEMLITIPTHKP
jgi:hypothetical protein